MEKCGAGSVPKRYAEHKKKTATNRTARCNAPLQVVNEEDER